MLGNSWPNLFRQVFSVDDFALFLHAHKKARPVTCELNSQVIRIASQLRAQAEFRRFLPVLQSTIHLRSRAFEHDSPPVVLEQMVRSVAIVLSLYRLSGLKTIPVSVVNTSPVGGRDTARDEMSAQRSCQEIDNVILFVQKKIIIAFRHRSKNSRR